MGSRLQVSLLEVTVLGFLTPGEGGRRLPRRRLRELHPVAGFELRPLGLIGLIER